MESWPVVEVHQLLKRSINRVRMKRNNFLLNEQDSLQESLAENSHINAHDSKEADIEIPSELDSNFENSALLEFVQRQVG